MKKEDRRVRRTYQLLGDALIEVAVEKGYDSVTIKDITDRANVAYVTFFRHFQHKDELLQNRLEALFEDIERITHQDNRETEGLQLFCCVEKNHRLFKMLLGNRGAQHIVKQFKDHVAGHLLHHCRPLLMRSGTSVPPEIIANHAAVALFGLVEWWLEHDMPYPPEDMSHIYEELILAPVGLTPMLQPSPEHR